MAPRKNPTPAYSNPPQAYPGMAVGLLGGSFNPAHEGHLAISLYALNRLRLDRLWWLVSPGNPLKCHSELRPFDERLATARGLTRHPRIDVTGFEAGLRRSHTRHTLDYLQRRYPGTAFVWLMGADNLAVFHRWLDWREIFGQAPIAVIDRPGCRHGALAGRTARAFAAVRIDDSDAVGLARLSPPAWTLLTVPLSAQSSTALRRRGAL